MQFEIQGQFAQYARLTFQQGETCWASKGGLMSHGDRVEWTLRVPDGVVGAARRILSGEGVGLALLQARGAATATLANSQAGRIFAWDLKSGPVVTTRGSFLAAWGEVDINATIARRAGAALFGGAGLFLQRIAGNGVALVHAAGDLDDRELGPGEVLTVSTGHLAALSDTVDYDVRYVGGARKALFGGEGLFMTRLIGPGRVLLQSLKRKPPTARRPR